MGIVILLFHCAMVESSAAEERSLSGLSEKMSIFTDKYGIPHIYARSWPDACRALGYLHATDRLWEMDVFRRQAIGTSAEVFGRGAACLRSNGASVGHSAWLRSPLGIA